MTKLRNLFYGTFLGGLYFEFLLWLDRRSDKSLKYLTPKEMSQIVKESSKLYEGVQVVKSKVNQLVNSRTKEEYHKILCEIEDLTKLTYNENNSERAKFSLMLREAYVKKRDKDVVSHTDMAKMIDQRIQDHSEMWYANEKRSLMRNIRQANQSGDKELAEKLVVEYNNKYGRSKSRTR